VSVWEHSAHAASALTAHGATERAHDATENAQHDPVGPVSTRIVRPNARDSHGCSLAHAEAVHRWVEAVNGRHAVEIAARPDQRIADVNIPKSNGVNNIITGPAGTLARERAAPAPPRIGCSHSGQVTLAPGRRRPTVADGWHSLTNGLRADWSRGADAFTAHSSATVRPS
jgi:hypothetical protein